MAKSLYTKKQERKYAKQRVKRGWSDRDWWSIDHHIAEILSQTLRKYVEDGHCYIEDKEDWMKHSEVLGRYKDKYDLDFEEGELYYAEVQKSMHWVAENFGRLWD
jgi:hypothetical protein